MPGKKPTRFLLFLMHRGGSHMVLKLLRNRPLAEYNTDNGLSGSVHLDGYMVTDPPNTATLKRLGSLDELKTDSPDNCFWYTHIGDWWGQPNDSSKVPDAYDGDSESRWGPDELNNLISDEYDWRFAAVLRKPADLLESFRLTKGQQENQYRIDQPEDYFITQCKSIYNRYRVIFDCSKHIPKYTLFRFESFIIRPVVSAIQLMNYMGISADSSALVTCARIENEHKIKEFHSSFKGEMTAVSSRQQGWTENEHELFKQIVLDKLPDLN